MMSFSQWKRLLIVAVGPLLLAGWLLTRSGAPTSPHITCLQTFHEKCVNWGDEYSQHELGLSPAWFQIFPHKKWSDESFYISALGSQRWFDSAEIIDATPYHVPKEESINWANRDVSLLMGGSYQKESSYTGRPKTEVLSCRYLHFGEQREKFEASECRNSEWHGYVTFILGGQELEQVMDLRQSLDAEVSEAKWLRRWYQIVAYPIFVYLFLLASASIWICLKAFRFVKTGKM